MGKAVDLTGQTFGRLTVLERAGSDRRGNAQWLCQCECGNSTVVVGYHLRSGNTQSCGCYSSELTAKRNQEQFTKRAVSADMLRYLYVEQSKSTTEIAELYGVQKPTVLYWLKSDGIPTRTKSESRKVVCRKSEGKRHIEKMGFLGRKVFAERIKTDEQFRQMYIDRIVRAAKDPKVRRKISKSLKIYHTLRRAEQQRHLEAARQRGLTAQDAIAEWRVANPSVIEGGKQ